MRAGWASDSRLFLSLRGIALALTLLAAPLPALAEAGRAAVRGTVEVVFTPWDDAEGAVLRVIREARRELYVQAFLFTSRTLALALLEARERGVRVEVLADATMNTKGSSQIRRLAQAGIPVALETRYGSAHNKVILADPREPAGAVLTGSYNFTWSAKTQNAENILILRGDAQVARAYLENWRRHRAQATPYAEFVAARP